MHAAVVLNIRSRETRKQLGRLDAALHKHGIAVEKTVLVDNHTALRKRIRTLCKRGIDAFLIGGGDGTMRAAAAVLAHTGATLGVLPFGTGNSFARTLGIAPNLDAALAAVAGGRRAQIDIGHVNGRVFVNFAVVGLSADIAGGTPRGLKDRLGTAAYAVAGLVPFLRERAFRARVRWDAGELDIDAFQMVIASGRCFGSRPLLPEASSTDGRLAFFTTDGDSHLALARSYLALGLGLQTRLPDAHAFFAPEIRITTRPHVRISLDGSSGGRTPATFRVDRGALRVFIPPGGIPA